MSAPLLPLQSDLSLTAPMEELVPIKYLPLSLSTALAARPLFFLQICAQYARVYVCLPGSSPALFRSMTPSVSRYCLSGLPVDCQMKNITSPDQTSLLLEHLIIWTNYEIEVAAYNGAGRGTYSHKVTEWTLQGGEASLLAA